MIIADDDFLVREGLRSVIEWADYDIEIIAEAENGKEAMALCKEHTPDIIITDIKMPFFDGLDVTNYIREEGFKTKVILLSGYQDFNYAKTALENEVSAYLLKPLEIEELIAAIKRVSDLIKIEKNRSAVLCEMEIQLQSNIPVLRENYLKSIVSGYSSIRTDTADMLSYLQLPFTDHELLIIGILKINLSMISYQFNPIKDMHLVYFAIANILKEMLLDRQYGISYQLNDSEFVIIYNQKTIQGNLFSSLCEDIIQYINVFLKIDVNIGLGDKVSGIYMLPQSFANAKKALNYKFYSGANSIISINDIDKEKNNTDQIQIEAYKSELLNAIDLGNTEQVKDVLSIYFNEIIPKIHYPVDRVKSFCIEIITYCSRYISSSDDVENAPLTDISAILIKLLKIPSLDTLNEFFTHQLLSIAQYNFDRNSSKNDKTVELIFEIINNSYMDNLSIQKIADQVFYTPNYISTMFRNATGERITEYIARVRIDKAVEFLLNTDLKVSDIATKVGFENANYFSTVFKKLKGCYPKKYREDIKEQGY